MPALSAVDAIGPALRRTKAFLFQPFRWPTFLKLCLVAVLTEGFGASSNFNFSWPGGHTSSHSNFLAAPPKLTPPLIAAIAAGVLAVFVLFFVIFYLITRLRFAYFHCLVTNTRLIRPGWSLYRSQATRFFWLNVVVCLCVLAFAAILALPFFFGFWRLFKVTPPGGHPPVGMLISLVLLVLLFVFLFALAALTADVVLRDFMMPHFALENATSGQAWTAAWARIKAEKLPFFVYLLLRLILPLAAMIGVFFVLIIPALIVIAAFVFLGIAIHSAFAGATGGALVVKILLYILMGLVAIAIWIFVALCVGGPLGTAVREYALLFYGARYDSLGAFLFPPLETPLPPESPLPPPQTA
jgi:hypothetical protein